MTLVTPRLMPWEFGLWPVLLVLTLYLMFWRTLRQ